MSTTTIDRTANITTPVARGRGRPPGEQYRMEDRHIHAYAKILKFEWQRWGVTLHRRTLEGQIVAACRDPRDRGWDQEVCWRLFPLACGKPVGLGASLAAVRKRLDGRPSHDINVESIDGGIGYYCPDDPSDFWFDFCLCPPTRKEWEEVQELRPHALLLPYVRRTISGRTEYFRRPDFFG
jgi:hypothetical protein